MSTNVEFSMQNVGSSVVLLSYDHFVNLLNPFVLLNLSLIIISGKLGSA